MGARKYPTSSVSMGEVADWRNSLKENYDVRARIVWSTGAKAGEWRVTAQAVHVEGERAVVVAEVYDVWPRRGASCVEALMLQLLVSLERQLELDRPLLLAPSAAA